MDFQNGNKPSPWSSVLWGALGGVAVVFLLNIQNFMVVFSR